MKKLFVLFSIFVFFYSCVSKADTNFENLKKIEKGMTIQQVDSIMIYKPNLREEAFWDKSKFVYYYESGFGSSDDFKIIFSKTDSIVTNIECGD